MAFRSKKTLSLLLSLAINIAGFSQDLESYFISGMKSQLQINQELRQALITKYRNGEGNSIQTPNGGITSVLEYKENDYLKISPSSDGYFSMKRWVINGVPVFGLSWWVCSPFCDGVVKIATESNTVTNALIFPQVTISDFANKDSLAAESLTSQDFADKFEVEFIHYEFTASDTIWAINQTEANLDEIQRPCKS